MAGEHGFDPFENSSDPKDRALAKRNRDLSMRGDPYYGPGNTPQAGFESGGGSPRYYGTEQRYVTERLSQELYAKIPSVDAAISRMLEAQVNGRPVGHDQLRAKFPRLEKYNFYISRYIEAVSPQSEAQVRDALELMREVEQFIHETLPTLTLQNRQNITERKADLLASQRKTRYKEALEAYTDKDRGLFKRFLHRIKRVGHE